VGDDCTHCVDGMCYRALENTWTKDSSDISCQNYYIEMPEGWEVADYRCDILKQYGWNSHMMCFSDGQCPRTANFVNGGSPCDIYNPTFVLAQDGNSYKSLLCHAGVMIQRPAAGFSGEGCNEPYPTPPSLSPTRSPTGSPTLSLSPTTFLEPTGLVISPSHGRKSTAEGLRVYASNDCPECDPVSYILEGRVEETSDWVLVHQGDLPWKTETSFPRNRVPGLGISSTYMAADKSFVFTEVSFSA